MTFLQPRRPVLLLSLLAVLPALACGFLQTDPQTTSPPATADAIPLATEEAPPTSVPDTPTPDVISTADFQQYESENLGLAFRYPQGWALEEGEEFVTTVSNEELLLSDTFDREGAGMIITVRPDSEFQGETIEEALRGAIDEMPYVESPQIVSEPTALTIAGQEAATATVEGVDEATGETLVIYATVVRGEGQAAIATGVTLAPYQDRFRPFLDAIAQTIELSQPAGPTAEGSLEYGETVRGSVPLGASSAWSFIGVEGEIIDVVAMPVDQSLDLVVDVLDSSGTSILESGPVDDAFGAEEIRRVELPATDEYTVLLNGFAGSSGQYELTISEAGVTVPSAAIAVGDRFSATIGPDELTDYAFLSADGLPVTVVVEPQGDLDVVVEIIHPQDGIIAEEDSSFGRETISFTPTAGLEYLIRVRGFAGAGGDYTISLAESSLASGSTIVASDTLPEDHEGHAFPFEALEGAFATAIVEPEGDFDVVLEVWEDLETDEQLDSIDLSFGTEQAEFIVPQTGLYFFNVVGYEGQSGDYTVTLSGDENVIFEVAYDDVVEGVLGDAGFLEYRMRLDAGETARFTVQSDETLDAVVEMLDLDDNSLAEADEGLGGETEQMTFTAPTDIEDDTVFILRISAFDGAGGGSFTLTVEPG